MGNNAASSGGQEETGQAARPEINCCAPSISSERIRETYTKPLSIMWRSAIDTWMQSNQQILYIKGLTDCFRQALAADNPRRALYAVVSGFVGTSLDYELGISDPDTGHVFGYLLPPWRRDALSLVARRPHLHKELLTERLTVDSLRIRLREETIAAPASDFRGSPPLHPTSPQPYQVSSDKTQLNELVDCFEAALRAGNPRRAFYVAVTGILGPNLEWELGISDPDTGHVFGYLLPPWRRDALSLVARRPHLHKELLTERLTVDSLRIRLQEGTLPPPPKA